MAPHSTSPTTETWSPPIKTPVTSPQDVYTTLNYTELPAGANGLDVIGDQSGVPEDQRRMKQRDDITVAKDVVIKDVRGREDEFKLDVQGFQYVNHSIEGVTDWTDPKQITEKVQPATVELVKKLTGASKVVVYLDRNRFNPNEKGSQMSTAHSPSHGVHTDLTHASCHFTLAKSVPDPAERDELLSGRYIVVNVWRPVVTIKKDPLTVCDWRSVDPVKDIYNDRRVVGDNVMEFGLPIYSDKHEWYYLNEQRPDEPLVFKQLDSNLETNITLPHSAFVDPKYVDYPPRRSIEMKCFAFFD
ncbi:hypothetical protein EJ05DRAFT_506707 [Pseudovirgaria hyperparasitica]|uniref:Methyltransferase n=1 Tax=Pseudovirgaria hyperparasitica TaxID=470096 RepID=A0A6A6WM25_9PEZI|nr:uncharacterized protein EJ05DRAFT_506707 [Pseudovirgaria hyperparasitica]KAF2763069.1 hypothetical protein EJ05DRAFT_506707 [Pseudovirgaria hyperparasitica]